MTAEPDIAIRPARDGDLPAIVALLADDPLGRAREEYREPLPAAYYDAFRAIGEQRGNVVLVAEAAGQVVGCLQFTAIPGLARRGMKRGQIEGVRIGAGWRGRGLGERLVRHAIALAEAEGCGLVQLTTDNMRPDAHRFYQGLGFAATHLGMKLVLQ
jgi:ribosomal protein S18 acetylase RimI-like enzyme